MRNSQTFSVKNCDTYSHTHSICDCPTLLQTNGVLSFAIFTVSLLGVDLRIIPQFIVNDFHSLVMLSFTKA